MDFFTKNLKHQINIALGGKADWDTNPLVVIGLTESILGLGLTEDQIYNIVRSYGRQLAAQVHPDRKNNLSFDRQKQIIEAFDLLDNKEIFSKALSEFRNIRAEDRRESTILRNTLNQKKIEIDRFNEERLKLERSAKALEEERAAYNKLKLEEPLVLPEMKTIIERQNDDIRLLRQELKTQKELYTSKKKGFDYLAKYMANFYGGLGVDNQVDVFSAKWMVTISMSWNYAHPQLIPFDEKNNLKPDFYKAMFLSGAKKKDLEFTIESWKKINNECMGLEIGEKNMPLGISVMSLSSGYPKLLFGIQEGVRGGRVIGSTSSGFFKNKRYCLHHNINYKSVYEWIDPILSPDRCAVSIYTNKRNFASWSNICPSFKFNTKKIIISCG